MSCILRFNAANEIAPRTTPTTFLSPLCTNAAPVCLDLLPPGSAPRTDIANWVDSTPKELLRPSLCPQYVIYLNKTTDWFPPALVLPPVLSIIDNGIVIKRLKGKYRHLVSKWEKTKQKLIAARTLMGLNFKPWQKDGDRCYSVRIDKGYRAHLKHEGNGHWTTYILGSHQEMGHG